MFKDYIGQKAVCDILSKEVTHSLSTGRVLPHILLTGQAGLGKTELAKRLSSEVKSVFVPLTGDSKIDVTKTLLSLDITGYGRGGVCGKDGKRYVIFVDEVHMMKSWEAWYEPLQSCQIFVNGKIIWLPDFTFIGATTDSGKIPKPMLDRIPTQLRLESYSIPELSQIICKHFPQISESNSGYIAQRSRQVARIALNYAGMFVRHGSMGFFDTLGIDERGLNPVDRQYLFVLGQYERPLSLNTLSALTGVAPRELTDIVEPYLKALGLVVITPGGRMLVGGRIDLNSRSEGKVRE